MIRDDYWLFLGITMVGMILAGLVPLFLVGPALCGVYLCYLRRWHGRTVPFEKLFDGFQYFGPSLIATLLMVVPTFLVVMVVYVMFIASMILFIPQQRGPLPPETTALLIALPTLFMIALVVITSLVHAVFLFTYPLIVDRELSGSEAVRLSVRAARANLGGVLGLVLLNSVVSLVGFLLCFVGIYFLMPFVFASTIVAYRRVFPADDALEALAGDFDPDDDLIPSTQFSVQPSRRPS